jgi:hypothetical protein
VNLCWVLARIATVRRFTTTRSELVAAHWLADRFPERFEAHSRTVVQDRADVPTSTSSFPCLAIVP